MFQIGEKITKKIDRRYKNPDTRVWQIVGIKNCPLPPYGKMYDMVEVSHRQDWRFDYKEKNLIKDGYYKVEV